MPNVRIFYEGHIDVSIHADPEDAEAWAAAIAQAWGDVTDSSPRAVLESADAVGHALVCDECRAEQDEDGEPEIRPVSEAGAVLRLCATCHPGPRRGRARS